MLRTCCYAGDVCELIHDIWPSFLVRNDEKSDHGSWDIIEVLVEILPLTSRFEAILAV